MLTENESYCINNQVIEITTVESKMTSIIFLSLILKFYQCRYLQTTGMLRVSPVWYGRKRGHPGRHSDFNRGQFPCGPPFAPPLYLIQIQSTYKKLQLLTYAHHLIILDM